MNITRSHNCNITN